MFSSVSFFRKKSQGARKIDRETKIRNLSRRQVIAGLRGIKLGVALTKSWENLSQTIYAPCVCAPDAEQHLKRLHTVYIKPKPCFEQYLFGLIWIQTGRKQTAENILLLHNSSVQSDGICFKNQLSRRRKQILKQMCPDYPL